MTKEERLLERLRSRPWDEIGVRDALLFVPSWSSATKLVLLALVAHKGRGGTTRVGIRKVALLAGVHSETVSLTIAKLVAEGVVIIADPGRGTSPQVVDIGGLPARLVLELENHNKGGIGQGSDRNEDTLSGVVAKPSDRNEDTLSGVVAKPSDRNEDTLSGVVAKPSDRNEDTLSGVVAKPSDRIGTPLATGSGTPSDRIGTPLATGSKIQKESLKESLKESMKGTCDVRATCATVAEVATTCPTGAATGRVNDSQNGNASPQPVTFGRRASVESVDTHAQPGQGQARESTQAAPVEIEPIRPSAVNLAHLPSRRVRAIGDLMTCAIGELANRCKANPYDASLSPIAMRPELATLNEAWSRSVGLAVRPLGAYSERNRPLLSLLEAFETATEQELLEACAQAGKDDWCCGRTASKGDSPRKRGIECLSPVVLRRLLDAVDVSKAKQAKRLKSAEAAREEREIEARREVAPPPSVEAIKDLIAKATGAVSVSSRARSTRPVLTPAVRGPMTAEEIDAALDVRAREAANA